MANRDASKANTSSSIVRKPGIQLLVALDTATPPVNATAIDYRHYAAGRVIAASTIASVTLTWYECDTEGGTYVPCYNGGAAVTSTLPGGATTAASCEIPASLAGSHWLKITSNADDTETVTVLLKA